MTTNSVLDDLAQRLPGTGLLNDRHEEHYRPTGLRSIAGRLDAIYEARNITVGQLVAYLLIQDGKLNVAGLDYLMEPPTEFERTKAAMNRLKRDAILGKVADIKDENVVAQSVIEVMTIQREKGMT